LYAFLHMSEQNFLSILPASGLLHSKQSAIVLNINIDK
jgi:hypothetical protein